MTVNTTPVEINYTGNASTTVFALPFAFAANAHVKVYLGGVLQGSGYSITGAGNPSGGTLTMTTAPGTGVALKARRVTPLTQDIDVVNNATVFASSLETGLDYALMRQQEEAFDRATFDTTTAAALALKITKPAGTGFVALDAGGGVYVSSGTGADAGLRTDLAANTGFTLIKHKRPEAGTYARTAAQMDRIGALDSIGLSLMHWLPSDLDEAILAASNGTMLDTYIQSAFDNCPAEAALVFPPGGELRTNQTIENPRAVSIYGNRCQWRGYFGADTSNDLFLVHAVGDQRQFFMRDLYASFSTGGRNAVRLFSDEVTGALLEFSITNCGLGTVNGGLGTTGYALCIEGLGTHMGVVRGNGIAGGIYAASADRNVYTENLIYGHKGIVVNLIGGAYSTVFSNNGIVSRDGVFIQNGDNIFFTHNQVEQFSGYGANASAFGSQLTLYGYDRSVLNCVIENNNFGGGANCAAPVTMVANVERARFMNNQYNAGISGYDVRVLGSTVKFCSFDEQFTRGAGRDTSEPLYIFDSGTATRGIWKPSTILTFSNGWTANAAFGMSVAVTESLALLSGGLVVGSAAGLTDKITVVPEGYRPRADTILACANNVNNDVSLLVVKPNGDVFPAGTMPAAGSVLYLPASYRTKVANSVATGVV